MPEKSLYRDGACLIVGPDKISTVLKRVCLTPEQKQPSVPIDFDEAWLQTLIHDYPECLPISEIEAGLSGFHAIACEVPTPAGYIDNLLMSGMGDIAVVEVKLFRNHESLRKVLAQILDYAAALYGMNYASFEQAVLHGSKLRQPKTSLYERFAAEQRLPECEFIDAVSKNLANGKMLLLIVGDGIHTELQRLIEQLYAFGQMRFTLALVELAVHHLPTGGYLIRPGTLAKTEIIKRPVLEIVKATDVKSGLAASQALEKQRPDDMTSSDYWTALEKKVPGSRTKLEALLDSLQAFGVYPVFLASLNLKWDPPNGAKSVNFGYIQTYGGIFMDAAAWFASVDLAQAYVEELAQAWDGTVFVSSSGKAFTVYKHGKPIKLQDVLDKLNRWPPIIQRFQQAVIQRLSEGTFQSSPSSI